MLSLSIQEIIHLQASACPSVCPSVYLSVSALQFWFEVPAFTLAYHKLHACRRTKNQISVIYLCNCPVTFLRLEWALYIYKGGGSTTTELLVLFLCPPALPPATDLSRVTGKLEPIHTLERSPILDPSQSWPRYEQPLILAFTPMANIEYLVDLTCMSSNCRKKTEVPSGNLCKHGKNMQTWETRGSNPAPCCSGWILLMLMLTL